MPLPQKLSIKQAISCAKKLTKDGDISAAIALYDAILQQDPNHRFVKKALRKLQKEFLVNPSHNNTAIDPQTDKFDALIKLYHSGKLLKTERTCKTILQTHPQSFKVINVLGVALHGQGKSSEAIQAFDKAIEITPDFPDAHNNRGNVLKELGRVKEAMDSYNRAIKINPSYAEAFNNRGNVFKDQGYLEQAIDSYEKSSPA